MTDKDFEGRVVVITGAASGMGAASARAFVERGAVVEAIDVNAEAAADIAGELGLDPPHVGDVGDSAFCNDAIGGIIDRHGRIDVLVNAAGTIHRANALGTSDATSTVSCASM